MRPARTRWLAALITAGALLVSGCSGVPRSSRPEIVRPVDAGDNTVTKRPDVAPSPGDDPRLNALFAQLTELARGAAWSAASGEPPPRIPIFHLPTEQPAP